jgi:hypothetical protein
MLSPGLSHKISSQSIYSSPYGCQKVSDPEDEATSKMQSPIKHLFHHFGHEDVKDHNQAQDHPCSGRRAVLSIRKRNAYLAA